MKTSAFDGYIASLFSAYVRATGPQREALGKLLDLALQCRQGLK